MISFDEKSSYYVFFFFFYFKVHEKIDLSFVILFISSWFQFFEQFFGFFEVINMFITITKVF
jgi:hypothetical protein